MATKDEAAGEFSWLPDGLSSRKSDTPVQSGTGVFGSNVADSAFQVVAELIVVPIRTARAIIALRTGWVRVGTT